MRVVSPKFGGLPAKAGEAKRGPIDTLGRRCPALSGRVEEARERRLGGIPVEAFAGIPWKGKNPGEHPASRRAKHTPVAQGTLGRVKAQEPRPAGTGQRFGVDGTGGRNGRWVLPGGNAAENLARGKSSEG